MIPEHNLNEQNENLKRMNYSPENDIFNQEDRIPLDGDGNPITNEKEENDNLDEDLDVTGTSADDEMEKIGSEDEENNYYSLSDNEDNHEETNDDLIN